jgi:hypothetical protein
MLIGEREADNFELLVINALFGFERGLALLTGPKTVAIDEAHWVLWIASG